MNLKELIEEFIVKINDDEVEIYNEFSLHHELGIFLREKLKDSDYKVEFERNVSFFTGNKDTVKKEIDIVIYRTNNEDKKKDIHAIELKFPRDNNGQCPEQMYSFIKDIKFMEELKGRGFKKTYCLTIVDNKNFYSKDGCRGGRSEETQKMYDRFRNGKLNINKDEEMPHPTGEKNRNPIKLINNYTNEWKTFKNKKLEKWRYYLIEI